MKRGAKEEEKENTNGTFTPVIHRRWRVSSGKRGSETRNNRRMLLNYRRPYWPIGYRRTDAKSEIVDVRPTVARKVGWKLDRAVIVGARSGR